MAENSGIAWTHHTFNPWIGCARVSAACDHCYAEAWDARFGGGRWGPRAPRRRTKTWSDPMRWQRAAVAAGRRFRVFCASLADVFDNHPSIAGEWRHDLWALVRATPDLDWLLLTKRPQNARRFLPADWQDGYPNVWLGATVESQPEADRRVPVLLRIPARLHFLSCEPLLGRLDLTCIRVGGSGSLYRANALTGDGFDGRAIGWVIAGGESGPGFRVADPDWFRGLRDQCAEAEIPFLFKQWSGPGQRQVKALGRVLDGVVHDGYPDRERAA
jgi:protein gp37